MKLCGSSNFICTQRSVPARKIKLVGVLAAGIWPLVGCSDSALEPATGPVALAVQLPNCQAGCGDIDPNPSAPGVFLGSAVTPQLCFDGGYADADRDGLGDFCEKNLAAAFAPELYYAFDDDVRREPYRVAGILGTNRVRLGYLLSYYEDLGTTVGPCGSLPLPKFWQEKCWPHPGDSEDIYLDIYYDSISSHWILDAAYYSQHGDYEIFSRGSNAFPPGLTFPGHSGAYPRAYVAQWKHANYSSVSACNAGATLHMDTCEDNNRTARVVAGALQNVGSRDFHGSGQGLDCVLSTNPDYEYYGSGRLECYWTDNQEFRGWIPITAGGAGVETYSPKLSAMGF